MKTEENEEAERNARQPRFVKPEQSAVQFTVQLHLAYYVSQKRKGLDLPNLNFEVGTQRPPPYNQCGPQAPASKQATLTLSHPVAIVRYIHALVVEQVRYCTAPYRTHSLHCVASTIFLSSPWTGVP